MTLGQSKAHCCFRPETTCCRPNEPQSQDFARCCCYKVRRCHPQLRSLLGVTCNGRASDRGDRATKDGEKSRPTCRAGFHAWPRRTPTIPSFGPDQRSESPHLGPLSELPADLDHLEEHDDHCDPANEKRQGPKIRQARHMHDCVDDSRPKENGCSSAHSHPGQIGDQH